MPKKTNENEIEETEIENTDIEDGDIEDNDIQDNDIEANELDDDMEDNTIMSNNDLLEQQIAMLAGQLTETNALLRQVVAQLATRNQNEQERKQKFSDRKPARNFEDRKFEDRPRREYQPRSEGRSGYQGGGERGGYQGRSDNRNEGRSERPQFDRGSGDRPQRGFGPRGDSQGPRSDGPRSFGGGSSFPRRDDRGPSRESSGRDFNRDSTPRAPSNDFPRRKDHGFGGRGPRKRED